MTTSEAAPEYVLVVDDEPGVRNVLARGLWEAGLQCVTAADGHEAISRLQQGRYAVMLCDIAMPGMNGMEVLEAARRLDPDMVVIMVTAYASLQTALGSLRNGAHDYVTKPFQLAEIEIVIERALEHRRLKIEHRDHLENLEQLVEEHTRQVREAALGVVASLALALEAKDEYFREHSRRVTDLAVALGRERRLEPLLMVDLREAGALFDIGKIGVREAIIGKSGPLTADEVREMKAHAELGARILSPLKDLARVVPMIRHHHEWWDGGGYPDGLCGEAIPLGGRILHVADAYIAMRERRPHRAPMARERALREMRLASARQFDPSLVEALLSLERQGQLDALDPTPPEPEPELATVTPATAPRAATAAASEGPRAFSRWTAAR